MKRLWVAVEWEDAHGDASMFTEVDMEHKPYVFITGGLLIRSDEMGVSLARELGEDGKYRDHAFIPRKMVLREWTVGPFVKKPRRVKTVPHE
jgi:hypothetical protein